MCGIAGWIDREQDLTGQGAVVEDMARTMTNRGPDAAGVWLARHAALAHRRLIVIDPGGGSQPMTRRRGAATHVVVYNGELYNTPELRHDLEALGYAFQGYSDTEALLLAYLAWGPACTERLNGIFAFGIWNEAEQSLFLARDQLGVKPLFYARRGSSLIFASELKALLAHPAVRPELDATGLAEVLALGPGRTPGCGVFKDVLELRPGHWLLLDHRGIKVHRYWGLTSRPHEDGIEATAHRVYQLLGDAVERQLVADVPLCVLLSGGLDSSAVSAFASPALHRNGRELLTFSVDYVGNEQHFQANAFQPNADAPWVRRMVEFLGSKHHNVYLDTPELATALTAAMRARDLPGMADVDSSLYLFSREVKKAATVAVSGEAADEIFGGYPWSDSPEAMAATTFPWVRLVRQRSQLLRPEVADYLKAEEYVAWRYQEALDEVPRLAGEDRYQARIRELAYLNITRFMPILLDRMDRMSMAVGLEVRVPFCDHRLVEYVWNIPATMKTHGNMRKGILRLALADVLPPEVLARQKSPYPKTHNPSFTAAVRRRLLAILEDPSAPLLQLIDRERVRAVALKDASEFSPAWFSQLMGGPQLLAYLVQVDAWLREYNVSVS